MRHVRPGDGHRLSVPVRPGYGHRCSLARTGFALLTRKSSTGVRRLSMPVRPGYGVRRLSMPEAGR